MDIFNKSQIERLRDIVFNSAISTIPLSISSEFISRTAVKIQTRTHGDTIVTGLSVGQDIERTKTVAKWECLERILGHFDLRVDPEADYRSKDYLGQTKKTLNYKREDLILGLGKIKDAIGLAIHTRYDLSMKHSVNELIERWLLGRLFYEDEQIYLVSRNNENGLVYSYYTMASISNTGFCVCICDNVQKDIMTLGAAKRSDFSLSKIAAKRESMMLMHDAILEKSYSHIKNEFELNALESQKDPIVNQARRDFFSKAHVYNGQEPLNPDSNNFDIIKKFGGEGISIFVIAETDSLCVTKAIGHQMPTINEYRVRSGFDAEKLIDFVC